MTLPEVSQKPLESCLCHRSSTSIQESPFGNKRKHRILTSCFVPQAVLETFVQKASFTAGSRSKYRRAPELCPMLEALSQQYVFQKRSHLLKVPTAVLTLV